MILEAVRDAVAGLLVWLAVSTGVAIALGRLLRGTHNTPRQRAYEAARDRAAAHNAQDTPGNTPPGNGQHPGEHQ